MIAGPFITASALLVALALAGLLCGCSSEAEKPLFNSTPTVVNLQPIINEVSGIADSKAAPGHLWAQEDGGNGAKLHLINHNGQVAKTIQVKATNQDWEDMALVGNNLYLADIGDNNGYFPVHAIYRFAEPAMSVDTVRNVDTLRFGYSDGSHDAEALLVDPLTNDIFIISKWDNPSRIYRLAAPQQTTGVRLAETSGQLTYSGVTGAAISPDGKEVIVKAYLALNYYTRQGNESLSQTLQRQPKTIPYQAEPQGEAVCFKADNSGYFTLSEKANAAEVKLYFYRRSR